MPVLHPPEQKLVVAVLAAGEEPTGLMRSLGRLAKGLPVRVIGAAEARNRAERLAHLVAGARGCVLVSSLLPHDDARAIVETCIARDAWVVMAGAAARSVNPGAADKVVVVDGLATEPALAELTRRIRRGEVGELQAIRLQSPAGRTVRRASSKRTPFGDGANVSARLSDEETGRLADWATEPLILAELLVPGARDALEVSEVAVERGADRIASHARLGSVSVELELDADLVGEGPLELGIRGSAAAWVVRWTRPQVFLARIEGRSVVPLPVVAGASSVELAVRHALHCAASPPAERPSPASLAACRLAREATVRALQRYAQRLQSRPASAILVHVPRLRSRDDMLRLPPLALARLAAFTRGHGFATFLVDLQAAHHDEDLACFDDDAQVDAYLAGEHPPEIVRAVDVLWTSLRPALDDACQAGSRTLIGFSVVDYLGRFQLNIATCLARRAREHAPVTTVLGGERDQVDARRALSVPNAFEYVVQGDGEAALLALCHLVAYDDREPRDVPGVWSRAQGRVVEGVVQRSHLNALPRPDFDGIPLDAYRRGPSDRLPSALARDGRLPSEPAEPAAYLPYSFVKGCVANCQFCSAKEHLDIQDPHKSADELLALADRHAVRDFMFLNNLVNASPRWLERFCRRLIESRAQLQWTDSCRPVGVSAELAAAMRESGCVLLNFGAESGSNAVLARMNKGLRVEDIIRTLRHTHRAGIVNRVNFIAGYLHEKPEDVDATMRLVDTLAEEIDFVGCFQGFYLFPGMGIDPGEAGIVLKAEPDRLETGQVTLAYDEVGGLPWEAKRRVIEESRQRIRSRMISAGLCLSDKIDEYDLFYLMRRFDKATAMTYLRAPRASSDVDEQGSGRDSAATRQGGSVPDADC